MEGIKMNILWWAVSIAAIETASLSFELILRGSIYDTLNTLPVFLMLLSGAVFMYYRGFRYIGLSVFLGLIIGIAKMNYIFYMGGLTGQGTMDGAYALFNCLYRGVSAGFITDAVCAVSKKLTQTGTPEKANVVKGLQERLKIL